MSAVFGIGNMNGPLGLRVRTLKPDFFFVVTMERQP
jgi:hypothetical protein